MRGSVAIRCYSLINSLYAFADIAHAEIAATVANLHPRLYGPFAPAWLRETSFAAQMNVGLPPRPRTGEGWRTGRDSNPRDDSSPSTHFPGVRLQPLGHLSVKFP